jgi:ribonuclease P protein component
VLPAEHRLRRSADFTEVVRQGRRAGRPLLTAHLLLGDPTAPEPDPALVGLVVGKAVGGSVVRSRTSRRLRHLLRDRLDRLPSGARLVVRAAPGAATADSAALGADLDAALGRALRTGGAR